MVIRERTSIGPKIDAGAAEALKSAAFATLNEAATYYLEAMPALYKRALLELRSLPREDDLGKDPPLLVRERAVRLTREEAHAIIELMRTYRLTPAHASRQIISALGDAIRREQISNLDEGACDTLTRKLARMPSFLVAVLEVWACSVGGLSAEELEDQIDLVCGARWSKGRRRALTASGGA